MASNLCSNRRKSPHYWVYLTERSGDGEKSGRDRRSSSWIIAAAGIAEMTFFCGLSSTPRTGGRNVASASEPYLHSLESLKLSLDAQRLTAEERTAILAQCAGIILAVSTIPVEEQPAPEADDVRLTIEEAAALIRRSTHWIYRHRKQLPWVKELAPRNYVCSKLGMERWLARRK